MLLNCVAKPRPGDRFTSDMTWRARRYQVMAPMGVFEAWLLAHEPIVRVVVFVAVFGAMAVWEIMARRRPLPAGRRREHTRGGTAKRLALAGC